MQLVDFWPLATKASPTITAVNVKILMMLLRLTSYNIQEKVVPNEMSSVFSGKLKQLN